MGIVLPFCVRHRAPTASAGAFRAAKETKTSAVRPAATATGVRKIASHHSSGMRSRLNHLRAAGKVAPMSAAMASADDQSRITSLKDSMATVLGASFMESYLGQFVLDYKANLSHDCGEVTADNAQMPDRMSETEERLAFVGRVKAARKARFDTQQPMCTILGIEQGTYKQYETRTPLPH